MIAKESAALREAFREQDARYRYACSTCSWLYGARPGGWVGDIRCC